MTPARPNPSTTMGRATGASPDAASPFAPSQNGNGQLTNGTTTRKVRATRIDTAPASVEQSRVLKNVAAGAVHDMGNILSLMGFDLDLLASLSLSPEAAGAVRSLRAETSFLRNLTHELHVAVADAEALSTVRQTRLAAWWPTVRPLLRAVHGAGVVVCADIPWGLPAACIGPDHLTQVVLNLVGNAAHAITEPAPGDNGHGEPAGGPRRGEVKITAGLVQDGRAIHLTVADDGAGMSPEVLARACERSFTTRAGLGGTGFGLTIVQRLVREAGGHVHIRSVEGAGTVVTIELPIGAETAPLPGGTSAP